ncbi:MAG TPA: TrkA C-terminal domain-containing protein [Egibacteraceae bacterium]|nr:TrkA C-terminal domain-containing protein [Egibacteraceae bacterium]
MFAIVTLLVVGAVSMLITRVATVALTVTGLSRQSARFQARSALSGVGFTTSEAEHVVNHPVRRRIVMLLMLLGNVGIVAAVASLMGTFIGAAGPGRMALRGMVLLAGLMGLLWAAKSRWVDRRMSGVIRWMVRRITDLDVRDYPGMLHLSGDYAVVEMKVEQGDWLADRTLAEVDLPEEGVLVLGIVRADGSYIGAPTGATRLFTDDNLLLYGRAPVLTDLAERRAGVAGEAAHSQMVAEQQRIVRKQEEREQADGRDAGQEA